jgi:hypothetical protein
MFDGEVSSLNKMKLWFNHNKDIFWVVEKVKRKVGCKTTSIVGYFSIIPLTNEATSLIKSYELLGTEFTTEHITKENEIPSSYYIGGVAAKGWRARGATVNYLKAKAFDLEDENARPMLTRPITKEGLKLADKYDFYPLKENVSNPMKEVHIRVKE